MSEKKSRKQYSDEYKSEAVRLVNESGKPVTQVARELGVNANVLHRWAREEREAKAAGKTRGVVRAASRPPAVERRVMTRDLGIGEFGRSLRCSRDLVQQAQHLLRQELSSVSLFEDAIPALAALRANGFVVAVVSNLAAPYGAPLKQLLHGLVDSWCLSYEIGAVKPDRAIFDALLERTKSVPTEVLMIGDRWESDVLGARQAGIQALLLDRSRDQSNSAECLHRLTDLEAVIRVLATSRDR
jgi:HAD superfamily hydrolase (TIGR01549 family)